MAEKKKTDKVLDIRVFGTTNMSARGQLVVPKQAREAMGLEKGEKFLVMEKANCLVLMPSEIADKFAKHISEAIKLYNFNSE